jgi:hypothetical protein
MSQLDTLKQPWNDSGIICLPAVIFKHYNLLLMLSLSVWPSSARPFSYTSDFWFSELRRAQCLFLEKSHIVGMWVPWWKFISPEKLDPLSYDLEDPRVKIKKKNSSKKLPLSLLQNLWRIPNQYLNFPWGMQEPAAKCWCLNTPVYLFKCNWEYAWKHESISLVHTKQI